MTATTSPKRPRSGSETRRTRKLVSLRVSEQDYQTLSLKAAGARLSLSGYLRGCALKAPEVKARRSKPTVDLAELSRLLVALNRIGNNVNQIARALNAGDVPVPALEELRACLQALLAMKREVLEAFS